MLYSAPCAHHNTLAQWTRCVHSSEQLKAKASAPAAIVTHKNSEAHIRILYKYANVWRDQLPTAWHSSQLIIITGQYAGHGHFAMQNRCSQQPSLLILINLLFSRFVAVPSFTWLYVLKCELDDGVHFIFFSHIRTATWFIYTFFVCTCIAYIHIESTARAIRAKDSKSSGKIFNVRIIIDSDVWCLVNAQWYSALYSLAVCLRYSFACVYLFHLILIEINMHSMNTFIRETRNTTTSVCAAPCSPTVSLHSLESRRFLLDLNLCTFG